MKIYICDDSKMDLLRLRHYLEKYAQSEKIDIEVEDFLAAADMLSAHAKAKEKPVLIFLDIYMNQMDGMEAANKLRSMGVNTSIVFTTSSKEHAMDAFQVYADGYLVKPFDYESFLHAISRVSSRLHADYKMIDVRIDRMNRKFRIKDICFAETENHGVRIHCMDNIYRASITMEGMRELIGEESSFIMCGRSYLINLDYVKSVDSEMIYMQDQETIPIPVRLRKQIKEQYQQYLLGKQVP